MSSAAFAQTNVRAWYVKGQVWILWINNRLVKHYNVDADRFALKAQVLI